VLTIYFSYRFCYCLTINFKQLKPTGVPVKEIK
jgi:hypothetical protein